MTFTTSRARHGRRAWRLCPALPDLTAVWRWSISRIAIHSSQSTTTTVFTNIRSQQASGADVCLAPAAASVVQMARITSAAPTLLQLRGSAMIPSITDCYWAGAATSMRFHPLWRSHSYHQLHSVSVWVQPHRLSRLIREPASSFHGIHPVPRIRLTARVGRTPVLRLSRTRSAVDSSAPRFRLTTL